MQTGNGTVGSYNGELIFVRLCTPSITQVAFKYYIYRLIDHKFAFIETEKKRVQKEKYTEKKMIELEKKLMSNCM